MNSAVVASITVDETGVCNFCRHYDAQSRKLGTLDERRAWLDLRISEIKKAGARHKHDCLLGVSGGVDSTYLAYWLKSTGLRPLLVHFDNGWDSELATENIRNICDRLDLPLLTYVINWEEFRELQLAYLRAGVIDIEALTDHAIMATVSRVASENRINYLISGFNIDTEAIMPREWVWDKGDWENIKDIYKKFGSGRKLRSFPHMGFYHKLFAHWFRKQETVQILNYIGYNKQEAKAAITSQLRWRDYGGKHYESVFTKFFQAYILPVKFKVDKRYAHISNLICSGQMSREDGLNEIAKPLYNERELESEKQYVCKKLLISVQEFDNIMGMPIRQHREFNTEQRLWDRYFSVINKIRLRRQ
jgi:N-acetyl sugar amidotransferase